MGSVRGVLESIGIREEAQECSCSTRVEEGSRRRERGGDGFGQYSGDF
jgi:hypothetical protein